MRGKPFLFDDFKGGVNLKDAPYSVAVDEARDLLNVVSTARGAVRKRDGSTSFADLQLGGLFASPSPDVMVGSGAGKLHGIESDGTATELKSGLDASAPWQFVHAPATGGQGPIWGMNGVDTPQQWDGVASATSDWTASSGTLPNGRFAVWAGNRLWVVPASDPTAVAWSDIRDVRSWPAANITRFDSQDGGDITGLGVVGPYVLVFKRDRAWAIYDLDTSANRALDGGAGCVAHRSIAETPRGTFFLSVDGIYVTDGNTAQRVSEPVGPLLEQAASSTIDESAGVYAGDHYYLSISRDGNGPDRTLDFDLALKSWWLHDLAAYEWAIYDAGLGRPELFCAHPDALAKAFVAGELRDLDEAFVGYWASSFHHFGNPSLRKRVRQVHFDGEGVIDFAVARDFLAVDEERATLDTAADDGLYGVDDGSLFGAEDGTVYGGAATVAEARAYSLGVARAWSFKFGNDQPLGFQVDSYTTALTQRRN